MKLLIKNANIVDTAQNRIFKSDILIENEKIKKISKRINIKGIRTLECKDKYLLPGLIDIHFHLRVPGEEDKEDFISGTRAAANGGFTTICCMPNTIPPIDNASVVKFITENSKKIGVIEVLPIGAMTKELKGEELAEIGRMHEQGIVAVSDDGNCIQNANVVRYVFDYCRMFNLLSIIHAEDYSLAERGYINEGYMSTKLGLEGIPSISESVMVARDIEIAAYLGVPVHFTHISCKETVDIIRFYRDKGCKVTCDTTPHHIFFCDQDLENFDTNLKVKPPLRTGADRDELVKAIKDGTIDIIGTDHAPHRLNDKEVEFINASFGISSSDVAFSVCYTALVKTRKISLLKLARMFTTRPANLLKIRRGKIATGEVANLTVFDARQKWTVKTEDIRSKGKNCPYIGKKLQGRIIKTVYKGKIIKI